MNRSLRWAVVVIGLALAFGAGVLTNAGRSTDNADSPPVAASPTPGTDLPDPASAAPDPADADGVGADEASTDEAGADEANESSGAFGERLTVADAKDGDSFVASDGVEYRVGLINTPESGECGGAEASRRTYDLLADGFTAQAYASDGNGRVVARITAAAGDLGVLLAAEGYADDRYLNNFRFENPAYAAELDVAFDEAREQMAGLYQTCWAGGSPRSTRPEPPQPLIGQPPESRTHRGRTGVWACHPAYVECLPDGPDLDCREVGHQVELFGHEDPFRLDGNTTTATDGTGCDSYPPFDPSTTYPYEATAS